MNKADKYFVDNMMEILENGTYDKNPRPKYKDGTPAHSLYITQVFEKYDLSKGEFPITTLRPIPVKSGIKEILWIYQKQTSDLSVLQTEYNVKWWNDWNIGNGTIGLRYGATVCRYDLMDQLLFGLVREPFGRRHIISLWQEYDFYVSEGLHPCAFMTMFSVRDVEGELFLDMTLVQRSSDYLVAGHINKMQYVAFQMMVAKHCGYRVGTFAHLVQNLHIYDRHIDQAFVLLSGEESTKNPILQLNVPDGTDFYSITADDFELIDYEPVLPQLRFELGI
jgi:thymidylate synthase